MSKKTKWFKDVEKHDKHDTPNEFRLKTLVNAEKCISHDLLKNYKTLTTQLNNEKGMVKYNEKKLKEAHTYNDKVSKQRDEFSIKVGNLTLILTISAVVHLATLISILWRN